MTSIDETCAKFMRFEPSEGHLPKKADEILVSQGLLKAMGLEGKKVGRYHYPALSDSAKRRTGLQEGKGICNLRNDQ